MSYQTLNNYGRVTTHYGENSEDPEVKRKKKEKEDQQARINAYNTQAGVTNRLSNFNSLDELINDPEFSALNDEQKTNLFNAAKQSPKYQLEDNRKKIEQEGMQQALLANRVQRSMASTGVRSSNQSSESENPQQEADTKAFQARQNEVEKGFLRGTLRHNPQSNKLEMYETSKEEEDALEQGLNVEKNPKKWLPANPYMERMVSLSHKASPQRFVVPGETQIPQDESVNVANALSQPKLGYTGNQLKYWTDRLEQDPTNETYIDAVKMLGGNSTVKTSNVQPVADALRAVNPSSVSRAQVIQNDDGTITPTDSPMGAIGSQVRAEAPGVLRDAWNSGYDSYANMQYAPIKAGMGIGNMIRSMMGREPVANESPYNQNETLTDPNSGQRFTPEYAAWRRKKLAEQTGTSISSEPETENLPNIMAAIERAKQKKLADALVSPTLRY